MDYIAKEFIEEGHLYLAGNTKNEEWIKLKLADKEILNSK